MQTCTCYHEENRIIYVYCHLTGKPVPLNTTVGVCWGTKEREECSCKGDELKCNFYNKVN